MSAVELHILAQRMQEAKKAAARRGELRLSLPVGYVYDPDGQVVLDPDEEVQAACRRPVPRVRGDRHLLRRGEGVPRAAVPHPRSGLDRGGQLDAAPPEPGAGDPAQPDLRRRLRLGPLQVRAQHRR